MFSGDLLFAGSIGRTDLPGGDYPTILRSLARVCLTLPDETLVLSGHGPQTTIGTERRTNPFLAGLQRGGPGRGGSPARGIWGVGPRAKQRTQSGSFGRKILTKSRGEERDDPHP